MLHNIFNEFDENFSSVGCAHTAHAHIAWTDVQSARKMNHLKSKTKIDHRHFAHRDLRLTEN